MIYSDLNLMIELQRTAERTTELQRELQNYQLIVENHRTIEVPKFLTPFKKTLLTCRKVKHS